MFRPGIPKVVRLGIDPFGNLKCYTEFQKLKQKFNQEVVVTTQH